MPGTVSLASIVTRVRRRADMENTDFVSDAEIQEYVENSYGALVDIMLQEGGGAWMAAVTEANPTVAGTQFYSVLSSVGDMTAARIYKVLGVEVQFDGKWRRIRNYPHWDLSRLQDYTSWNSGQGVFYHINWQPTPGAEAQISFEPIPQAVHYFRLWYIPYPADWSSGGFTSFQGYTGWDEYIVVDAAMKCLEKEESDTTQLARRKMELEERIRHHAQSMNYGEGYSIRDVYEDEYFDDQLPRFA